MWVVKITVYGWRHDLLGRGGGIYICSGLLGCSKKKVGSGSKSPCYICVVHFFFGLVFVSMGVHESYTTYSATNLHLNFTYLVKIWNMHGKQITKCSVFIFYLVIEQWTIKRIITLVLLHKLVWSGRMCFKKKRINRQNMNRRSTQHTP